MKRLILAVMMAGAAISSLWAATLTVNRYRGGFECNASLRHPHPQCRPTPWDGPVVYRYSFKMER